MSNYSIKWDETVPLGTGSKSLGDNYLRDNLTAVRERLDTEHISPAGGSGDALLMHTWAVVAKSGNYTATAADHVILVTTGASTIVITLPTAVGITGKPYKIKKIDSGVGLVNIATTGTETIDTNDTFIELTHMNDYVDLVSDGGAWNIVSAKGNLIWSDAWLGDINGVHTHLSDAEGGTITPIISGILGTWATKAVDTIYQALTDGFVLAMVDCSAVAYSIGQLDGYSDSSNPPTTKRLSCVASRANSIYTACLTMPVKKNDYYKVIKTTESGTPTYTAYWIPLGT